MVTFIESLKFLCILWYLCKSAASDPTIVSLANGKYQGQHRENFIAYEGIPYAEAPIGKNRFEPPKPYIETWDDIREAKKYGPKCMQWNHIAPLNHRLLGEEDCLFLNVFVPDTVLKSDENVPVAFHIHGG